MPESNRAIPTETVLLAEIEALTGSDPPQLDRALAAVVQSFHADGGTLHMLEDDGVLHLKAATPGIPKQVLEAVQTVPIGKGMAGLAVARNSPIDACNLQTDNSGSVQPGARATGLQGAIVVPVVKDGSAIGALGIGARAERVFTQDEIRILLAAGQLFAQVQ